MQHQYDLSDASPGKEGHHSDPVTAESLSSSLSWELANGSRQSSTMRENKAAKAQENPLMAIGGTDIDSLRSKKIIQELTINKLRYGEVGMIGRERECQELEQCLDRMMERKSKELIFIKGESGMGKSLLANSIEAKLRENGRTGAYALGKFDLNAGIHEPCSAISAAFGRLCIEVHKDPEQQVGESLLEELGEDACHKLAKLVPEVLMILPPAASRLESSQDDHEFEANQNRWEYAFRVLARVFCSKFSPLVLVLDDLQWADEYSWTIIDLFLSDTENSSTPLMIIGCFRSDYVNREDSLLPKVTNNLATKASKCKFHMTQIELDSLTTQQTNHIIMALLNIDDDSRTALLAELCYRRTLGNPHFVIEFITTLEEEELIVYNLGLLQWKWSVDIIEEKTMSTENVVDLLQARMRKLPASFQLLLQFAACLGATFRKDVLSEIWSNHGTENTNLDSMFSQLQNNRFLESFGSQQYRWTHDKVKEAALAMRGEERSVFQSEVGDVLLRFFGTSGDLGDMLFQVTDLINTGLPAKRLDYAKLNLQAAEKARGVAAFASAATYARNGIVCLPDNKWESNFATTLQLYTIAAEMELTLGNSQNLEAYSEEVLRQPKCSARDKTPIYISTAYEQLEFAVKPKEAVSTLLKALKGLNVSLFRTRALLPVNAVVSLIRTIRLAKRTPQATYQSLPIMTDKKLLAITRCLSKLNYTAYVGKESFIQILSVVRLVRMTLKHGISGSAGFAFSTLGLLTVVVMKDAHLAAYFADMALLMQEKSPDKSGEASTIYVATKYVFPWTRLHRTCTLNMEAGYKAGARSGDIVMGMWAHASSTILNPLHDGFPLTRIKDRCIKFLPLADDLKQELHGNFVKIKLQVILNLMALDEETTEISGTVCNSDELDMETFGADIHHFKLKLLVFFGEYDKAANLAIGRGNAFDKEFPGLQDGMDETFLRGIALYAMARKTRKRKYKHHANKARKEIGAWVKRGNPNIKLYYWLLCAEHASLKKDHKMANSKYDEAVTVAARTGNLCMAALANERYADYFQNVMMDTEQHEYRMDEAIRFYQQWGAYAKVSQLESRLQND